MKESINVSDDDWPRLVLERSEGMNVCRQCHEIKVETCTTCHLSVGEKTFVPISHDNTWLSRHKQESPFNDQLCDVCHRGKIRTKASFKITEQSLENLKSEGVPDNILKKLENIKNQEVTGEEQTVKFKSLILKHAKEEHLQLDTARYCADCHRGDIWPEDVHDNNYLYSHGVDALAGITTCITCHQREACLSCHENGGITFAQSHPKGWIFNHSTEARRQLNSCINCHEEEDCLGCHQTVRPHPGNWDRDITPQNKQVCLKCHDM
jgi:predicted CXXCH cytochrome family protein